MSRGTPLTFELDDDDLKLFLEEAEEQLELLDTALVELEGEPDPELLQRIFRAAHTLKGSSATIGHRKMASLTHAMETVLDAVRQNRLAPDREVVDALLSALDALRVLAEEVVTRVDSGLDPTPLERVLLDLLEDDGAEEEAPPAAAAGPSEAESAAPADATAAAESSDSGTEDAGGQPSVYLRVRIDPQCQLPGIRCFQVLQELDTQGKVVSLTPPREVVEAGGAEFTLEARLVTTANEEQLRTALQSIPDVSVEFGQSASEPAAESPAPAEPEQKPRLALVKNERETKPQQTKAQPARKTQGSQSVRIDVERLDGLMNLVGELVIDRTRLQQIKDALADVLKDAHLTELTENLEETTSHLARITDELQQEIMRSRMLPVRSVLTRLPRVVRDVAAKCGKKVELVTAGEETELDRSVIEELSDPLVHILRNAVDHGIESPEERRAAGKPETGTVTVTAWNQETYIYLSIKDDGRGIDTKKLRKKVVERGLVSPEAAEAASEEQVLRYIFLPGLSTAETVSDVSGRGVGMDIVRTNIERLNGHVTVHSTPGQGSEFIIQLPLTLATTKALMVVANGTVYAIPLVSVTEALAASTADIQRVGGRQMLRLRGKLLPVADLAEALGDRRERTHDGPRFVVAARHGEREVAFLVDRLLGEQDVVVKTLGDLLGTRKGLTGATILGDGTLGLIIDTPSLVSEHAATLAIA